MNAKKIVSLLAFLLSSGSVFAAPPECKEPGAPKGCFERLKSTAPKYVLKPIDVCDQAPIYDPEHGRITYPCGLKIEPVDPVSRCSGARKIDCDGVAKPAAISVRSPKIKIPTNVVRYMGPSTIHNNNDGTSTIDHGSDVHETINSADKERTVKEYKERGVTIIDR